MGTRREIVPRQALVEDVQKRQAPFEAQDPRKSSLVRELVARASAELLNVELGQDHWYMLMLGLGESAFTLPAAG